MTRERRRSPRRVAGTPLELTTYALFQQLAVSKGENVSRYLRRLINVALAEEDEKKQLAAAQSRGSKNEKYSGSAHFSHSDGGSDAR